METLAQTGTQAQDIVITVPSKPEYVGLARRIVAGMAQKGGLRADLIEDVKLAVGEACNNAILHGSPGGERDTVSIQCRMSDGQLIIEVKDQGRGFTMPRQKVRPPMALAEGGRGLVLIRMLMDEVSYRHSKGGGTLKMVKRLMA